MLSGLARNKVQFIFIGFLGGLTALIWALFLDCLIRNEMMNAVKDTVITLHYKMYDSNNVLLDETEEPIAYLHGGYDGIFPVVEEALHDKKQGDKIVVTLTPDDAFGEIDETFIRVEPLEVFPEEVEVGMVFEADDEDSGDVLLFRVTAIDAGHATIDANHPFAGMTLRFEGTVTDVRAATQEELQHGHVHGEHGHQH
jgi:FKBP-type peptidyl-prolyl cis-trans isomerase SlyD